MIEFKAFALSFRSPKTPQRPEPEQSGPTSRTNTVKTTKLCIVLAGMTVAPAFRKYPGPLNFIILCLPFAELTSIPI